MSDNRNDVTRAWGLEKLGIDRRAATHWNLPTALLYEHAVRRQEGLIARDGPFVVDTGAHTGRAPSDKFTIDESSSRDKIWWGAINHPLSEESFDRVWAKQRAYLADKELFVQDCYGGADPRYRLPVRIVTEYAWHSLFVRDMLIREHDEAALRAFVPEFTVIDTPHLSADPSTDGTHSGTFILVHLAKKLVLIGGTEYAGEIKKSVFSLLNYFLPLRGVLGMHCSANYGRDKDDVALFFGLSGTGKTTLSTSPDRRLIGDDEHGWSDEGIFNIEGGCYAKCIKLSEEGEPEIFHAIRRGSVLENVVLNADGTPDYDSALLTENTRAAYPVEYIANAVLPSVGGHPKNIVFLTADALGVLPPIARLTPEQAMFFFLNGYTAKVAGTEAGVKEPKAAFSTCFGQPFLPLHPKAYADLLKQKIERHDAKVWLVNTGWTGGPYGVGERMKLRYTRAMLHAAFEGYLDEVPYDIDPIFGLHIPTSCPEVPAELLSPRSTWSDPDAYDKQANELKAMFNANFAKFT